MYKLVNNGKKVDVYETATNRVIRTFKKQEEARNFFRSLKKGYGFSGWTPDFFLIKIK